MQAGERASLAFGVSAPREEGPAPLEHDEANAFPLCPSPPQGQQQQYPYQQHVDPFMEGGDTDMDSGGAFATAAVATAADTTHGDGNNVAEQQAATMRPLSRAQQHPAEVEEEGPFRRCDRHSTGAAVALFSEHRSTNSNAQPQFDGDGEESNAGRRGDIRQQQRGSQTQHENGGVPAALLSVPPRTPVSQIMRPASFASPLSVNTPAPSTRRKGGAGGGRRPLAPPQLLQRQLSTSASAASAGVPFRSTLPSFMGVGESPLMTAPPPATPAKQRRTIHTAAAQAGHPRSGDAGDAGVLAREGGRGGATRSTGTTVTTRTHNNNVTVSPSSVGITAALLSSPPPGNLGGGAVFRVPAMQPSKYARSETSRKRSAEVMSQFSALDIDESEGGSPTQQQSYATPQSLTINGAASNLLTTPIHSAGSFAFPSQPSQPYRGSGAVFLPIGGGGGRSGGARNAGIATATTPSVTAAANGNHQQHPFSNGCAMPNSPLLNGGGYATPTALSQHIDLSRVGDSLSQMLARPSQRDLFGYGAAGGGGSGLEHSQAETEYSNIFSKRILVDFREVKELGYGAFGKVALYEEGSTGQLVAVKVSAPLHSAADHGRIFRRERAVMSFLKGKTSHIVQLLSAWEEGRVPQVYLQLEYCPGGSVSSVAERRRERNEPWAESEVLVFLLHMAIALDCMHRENIAHVDFKPDNVLIDAFGNYKLSDFGCSVALDGNGRPCSDDVLSVGRQPPPPGCGAGESGSARANGRDPANATNNNMDSTPDGHHHVSTAGKNFTAARLAEWQQQQRACASPGKATEGDAFADLHALDTPQQSMMSVDEGDCRYLCADMLNQKRHFKAGDMFSLGMSLYELMSGEPLPKSGDAFLQLRRRVPTQSLRQRGYSQRLVDLVVALLSEEPTARPTARQVLQYVRPPPDVLQALADEGRMRAWTSQPGATGDEGSEDEERAAEAEGAPGASREGGRPQRAQATAAVASTSSAPAGDAYQQLRLAAATVEASSWLLETTQRDYVRRHSHLAGSGCAEAVADCPRAFSPAGPSADGHTMGRSSGSNAFFPPPPPPPCVMPAPREDACTPTVLQGGFTWRWSARPS